MLDVQTLVARPAFVAKEPGCGNGETYATSELVTRLVILQKKDPALFLERYGEILQDDELAEFDAFAHDYEVGWHLNRLRRSTTQDAQVSRRRLPAACASAAPTERYRASPSRQMRRNRRFRYLEQLPDSDDYFSDHSMRQRAPQLYHQYIGRFQADEPEAFAEARALSRPRPPTAHTQALPMS